MNVVFLVCLLIPGAWQTEIPGDSLKQAKHAQVFTFKGVVIDSLSRKPIVTAWIFVNNTTLDTVSGRNGFFRLSGIPCGQHEVIITATGYLPSRLSIHTAKDTLSLDTIKLLPTKHLPLQEMMGRTYQKRWQFFFQRFKKHFIGDSPFASEIAILNPWVIYFEEIDKKKWRALANDFLLIENLALGYRIKCYIEQFAVDGQVAILDGCLFFQPIKTVDPKLIAKWNANRKMAYYGSLMHFLRCLAWSKNDSLYKVYQLRGLENFYHTHEPSPQFLSSFSELVTNTHYSYEYNFRFGRYYVQVNYYGAGEEMAYRRFVNRMTGIQRLPAAFRASWLASRHLEVTFNQLGYFNQPLAVEVYGYWEYLRIPHRLPITYFP
ncbi:MAG: carboxypeptidase-like regulatory domain-containing protein [Bernardetiaceae bacterium]|nr:carboxypeptidase-like regulatory domain-containing protein [Bernardetiaceae bacterium]